MLEATNSNFYVLTIEDFWVLGVRPEKHQKLVQRIRKWKK